MVWLFYDKLIFNDLISWCKYLISENKYLISNGRFVLLYKRLKIFWDIVGNKIVYIKNIKNYDFDLLIKLFDKRMDSLFFVVMYRYKIFSWWSCK